MKLKFRVDDVTCAHVMVSVLAGEVAYGRLGQLTMNIAEYQLFTTALLRGTEQMTGHLLLEHEDRLFQKWIKDNWERLQGDGVAEVG